MPADVQDTLITILSEKTLPIPELGDEVQARKGFNVIATANDRDRGVNELSSALRRRFNTVVLPVPADAEEEVDIVTRRVADARPGAGAARRARRRPRRSAGSSRSSASCATASPRTARTKLKSPRGTLSTAEAISVVTNGMALAAHFGDGVLRAADVAAGIVGAVVKDPVSDAVVWQEYLETVVRERDGWRDFYRAAPTMPEADGRRSCSASATTGPARPGRCGGRSTRTGPDVVLIEGPPEADGLVALAAAGGDAPAGGAARVPADAKRTRRDGARPRSGRSPSSRRSGRRIRWAVAHDVPVRFCDLPRVRSASPRPRGARAAEPTPTSPTSRPDAARRDPIGAAGQAAGYDDPERWWEDMVEHQLPSAGDELAAALAPFEAIAEAMAAVRAAAPPAVRRGASWTRSGARRTCARSCGARRKQYERIAVVCGAWHVPALTAPLPTATADATVLRGLPKAKVDDDLGAVDPRPARLLAGLRRRGRLARLVPPPVHRAGPAGRALAGRGGRRAARRGPARLQRPRHRGGPAGRGAGHAARPAAGRAGRGHRGDPGGALRRRRPAAGADPPQAGRRRAARRGARRTRPRCRWPRDLAAAQRRLRLPPSALVTRRSTSTCAATSTWTAAGCCTGCGCSASPWGAPRRDGGRRGKGTFWESWRLAWQPEFAVDLDRGQRVRHHRARPRRPRRRPSWPAAAPIARPR